MTECPSGPTQYANATYCSAPQKLPLVTPEPQQWPPCPLAPWNVTMKIIGADGRASNSPVREESGMEPRREIPGICETKWEERTTICFVAIFRTWKFDSLCCLSSIKYSASSIFWEWFEIFGAPRTFLFFSQCSVAFSRGRTLQGKVFK